MSFIKQCFLLIVAATCIVADQHCSINVYPMCSDVFNILYNGVVVTVCEPKQYN